MGCSLSLSSKAYKGSTFFVKVTVKDEYKNIVTPTVLKWTLLDSAGAIVNSRKNVNYTPTDEVNYIALSGDDLQMADGLKRTKRKILISGTYVSLNSGASPFHSAAEFDLVNPDI